MSRVIWIVSIAVALNLIILAALYLSDKEKYFSWLFSFGDPVLNIIHFNDVYDITKASPWIQKILEYGRVDHLKIFSGDIISPSLVSNLMFGSQFIPMMKMIKVDYSVPGNHETDFGEDKLIKFVEDDPSNKWLLANLKMAGTNRTYGNLEESAIRNKNGFKIGLFGLVDESWLASSKIDKKDVDYEDFKVAARRVSTELKSKGCNLILAITHMSNADDIELLSDPENYINFIFGGHEHIYFVKLLNNRLLLKSGSDFEQFSSLTISLNDAMSKNKTFIKNTGDGEPDHFEFLYDDLLSPREEDTWTFALKQNHYSEKYFNVNIKMVKIDHFHGERNTDFDNYFQKEIFPVISDKMISGIELSENLDTREKTIGRNETEIGDFLADLLRIDYSVDIVLFNSGQIKLNSFFQGNQTLLVKDVLQFMNRPDPMEIVELDFQNILKVLQVGVKNLPRENTDFLCFSGLKFQVVLSKTGNKIDKSTILINQKSPNNIDTYSVLVNKYQIEKIFKDNKIEFKLAAKNLPKGRPAAETIVSFYTLPLKPENRVEFKIFKEFFTNVTLDELTEHENTAGEKSITEMNKQYISEHPEKETLSFVTKKLMKRLKFYSLAKSINEEGQNPVFILDLKKDNRLIIVENQEIVI